MTEIISGYDNKIVIGSPYKIDKALQFEKYGCTINENDMIL